MSTNTEALGFCRNCGVSFEQQKVISVGALTIDPIGDITWRGVPVRLSGAQRDIVYALAREAGHYITAEAVYNLLGSHATDESGLVRVQISRLKDRFLAVDPDFAMIKTAPHCSRLGYRWCA